MTPSSPHFELIERGYYKGKYPVVEITKDGGPILHSDEIFQFGLGNARLFLSAIDTIEEFLTTTTADGSTAVKTRILDSKPYGFSVGVEVKFGFERSDGVRIRV